MGYKREESDIEHPLSLGRHCLFDENNLLESMGGLTVLNHERIQENKQ